MGIPTNRDRVKYRIAGLGLVVEERGKEAKLLFRYRGARSGSFLDDGNRNGRSSISRQDDGFVATNRPDDSNKNSSNSSSSNNNNTRGNVSDDLPPKVAAKLFSQKKTPLCGRPMSLRVGENLFCCRTIALSTESAERYIDSTLAMFGVFVSMESVASSGNPVTENLDDCNRHADEIRARSRPGTPHVCSPCFCGANDVCQRAEAMASMRIVHIALKRLCRALQREEERCAYISNHVLGMAAAEANQLEGRLGTGNGEMGKQKVHQDGQGLHPHDSFPAGVSEPSRQQNGANEDLNHVLSSPPKERGDLAHELMDFFHALADMVCPTDDLRRSGARSSFDSSSRMKGGDGCTSDGEVRVPRIVVSHLKRTVFVNQHIAVLVERPASRGQTFVGHRTATGPVSRTGNASAPEQHSVVTNNHIRTDKSMSIIPCGQSVSESKQHSPSRRIVSLSSVLICVPDVPHRLDELEMRFRRHFPAISLHASLAVLTQGFSVAETIAWVRSSDGRRVWSLGQTMRNDQQGPPRRVKSAFGDAVGTQSTHMNRTEVGFQSQDGVEVEESTGMVALGTQNDNSALQSGRVLLAIADWLASEGLVSTITQSDESGFGPPLKEQKTNNG